MEYGLDIGSARRVSASGGGDGGRTTSSAAIFFLFYSGHFHSARDASLQTRSDACRQPTTLFAGLGPYASALYWGENHVRGTERNEHGNGVEGGNGDGNGNGDGDEGGDGDGDRDRDRDGDGGSS